MKQYRSPARPVVSGGHDGAQRCLNMTQTTNSKLSSQENLLSKPLCVQTMQPTDQERESL